MRITEQSGVVLAQSIRAGTVSARTVVDAHIELLERVDPALNAVAADRYRQARLDADRADARIADGDPATLPPLLGVPVTVKESIAVAGMPHSAGVVARKHLRPDTHATVVQRLVDAGAIPIAVTNTAEGCMWIETDNRVYGRTRNAYDPRRTAGGSSGGEGAAIGSGGSPLGLGTDTLGSIRIPAFCNGVFGHRPSLGHVPLTGAWPPPHGVAPMCSNGVLARRAEDLMPALRIIAGPDSMDPLVTDAPRWPDPSPTDLAGTRVTLIDDAFLPGVAGEMLRARDRAAAALEAAGAKVNHASMTSLRAVGMFTAIFLAEETGVRFADTLRGEGAGPRFGRELLSPRGDHTAAMRSLLVGEEVERRLPKSLTRRIVDAARSISDELTEIIGDGLLLHPTMPTVAPRHGRTVGRPWSANAVAAFSLAGVPVTQVPLGLGSAGLPLGVQVAAGIGNDHLTIAAALELERVFGGWVPPTPR